MGSRFKGWLRVLLSIPISVTSLPTPSLSYNFFRAGAYLEKYVIEDKLFPFTDRFLRMIFEELKRGTGIEKELTPKTLRHTHVVRAYKRGEGFESIFERIALAPDSRQEAEEMYLRLARRGI